MGLVAYTPAFPGFDYRWSVAFQERKFKLEYAADSLERRYALTTLDAGFGLNTELLDMFGFFFGVEATLMSKAKCRGTSPCYEGGGDSIAGQLHAGFNFRIGFMKLEPYWEHMPFSPINGTKSLTSYGLAVHFLPESFSAD